MKPEHGVAGLELSRRLKDLGVVQESQFYWDIDYPRCTLAPNEKMARMFDKKNWFLMSIEQRESISRMNAKGFPEGVEPIDQKEICSAFSVAELGAALPQQIEMKAPYYSGRLTLWAIGDGWQLAYNHEGRQCFEIGTSSKKEMADVFAEMLIKLLESKLITVESVNERLRNC